MPNGALLLAAWALEAAGSLRSRAAIIIERRGRAPRRLPDAWPAHHAIPQSRPIALVFTLVALSPHVERQFTGRQVLRVHMNLAQRTKPGPVGALPVAGGAL